MWFSSVMHDLSLLFSYANKCTSWNACYVNRVLPAL